jgi:hypothetical protein
VSSDLLQSKVALCSDYSQDNASRLSHVRENKRFNKLEVLFRLVFVSGHVEAGQIDHCKMRLGRSRDFHPKDISAEDFSFSVDTHGILGFPDYATDIKVIKDVCKSTEPCLLLSSSVGARVDVDLDAHRGIAT